MVGRPFDVRALSFSPLCCSLMLVIRSKNDIHPYFFFLDVIRIITIVVIFFFFSIFWLKFDRKLPIIRYIYLKAPLVPILTRNEIKSQNGTNTRRFQSRQEISGSDVAGLS